MTKQAKRIETTATGDAPLPSNNPTGGDAAERSRMIQQSTGNDSKAWKEKHASKNRIKEERKVQTKSHEEQEFLFVDDEVSAITSVTAAATVPSVSSSQKSSLKKNICNRKTCVTKLHKPTNVKELSFYTEAGLAAIEEQNTTMLLCPETPLIEALPKPLILPPAPIFVRYSKSPNGFYRLICFRDVSKADSSPSSSLQQQHAIPEHISEDYGKAVGSRSISIYHGSEEETDTGTTSDDGKLKHWFPVDPFEEILNRQEQELAWLFEESHHCLRGVENNTRDFKFILNYASPSLRAEIMKFGGANDEGKWQRLVRWQDDMVTERMQVVSIVLPTLIGKFCRVFCYIIISGRFF